MKKFDTLTGGQVLFKVEKDVMNFDLMTLAELNICDDSSIIEEFKVEDNVSTPQKVNQKLLLAICNFRHNVFYNSLVQCVLFVLFFV